MADHAVVQCFGIRKRPRKPDQACRKKYLWTAQGASSGNFGRKGVGWCPSCGTMPNHGHPINRYLAGTLGQQEAQEILRRDYDENWMKKEE